MDSSSFDSGSFIGVISDTHGLVRPSALEALAGARRILHAGDIGGPEVLRALESVAPVTAVRGNTDVEPWSRALPAREWIALDGVDGYMLHDRATLDLDPKAAGLAVVISGHSHRPEVLERNGVLYLNPGSAGPRRFQLPVTVARLYLQAGRVRAEIVAV
jgi:putative phosphoesterase